MTTTNDQAIEAEIQAKGLTAPRVTSARIAELISRIVYTFDVRPNGSTTTLAHAFLDGKFYLATGVSACVSVANFDAELGMKIATANAKAAAEDELWKLEGYALRERLAAPTAVYLKGTPTPEDLNQLREVMKKNPGGQLIAMPLPQGEAAWTPCHVALPVPGFWLVTVETDSGREVHVLELSTNNKWIHEGEFTFQHGYFFRPIAWAPRPAAYDGEVVDD